MDPHLLLVGKAVFPVPVVSWFGLHTQSPTAVHREGSVEMLILADELGALATFELYSLNPERPQLQHSHRGYALA
jgi:hypothetical protein